MPSTSQKEIARLLEMASTRYDFYGTRQEDDDLLPRKLRCRDSVEMGEIANIIEANDGRITLLFADDQTYLYTALQDCGFNLARDTYDTWKLSVDFNKADEYERFAHALYQANAKKTIAAACTSVPIGNKPAKALEMADYLLNALAQEISDKIGVDVRYSHKTMLEMLSRKSNTLLGRG